MPERNDQGRVYARLLPGAAPAREEKRSGLAVDPFRIIRALRRSWHVFVVALLLGAGASMLASEFIVPPAYQANAVLMFEGVPDVEGVPPPSQGELRTLVDSVTVTPNLQEVSARMGGDTSAESLFRRVEVGYSRGSQVFNVEARGSNGEAAAKLANTVVDVFQDNRRQDEKARLQAHLDTVEDDLELAQSSLAKSRKRYDAFREEHGISDLSAEQEQAIVAAAELQAAADLAGAEASAQDVRLKQLRVSARRLRSTTVLSATHTSPDRAELLTAQTKLAQARAQFSDDHPRVQALEAQVDALRVRVATSKATVADTVVGLNPTYQAIQGSVEGSAAEREAAKQRETSLAALTEAARERVARLSRIEGEASALLASVQIAETHLNDLQSKRTRLTDAVRNPVTGFRVMAPAATPEAPIPSNKRVVVMAAFPFLFLLFSLAVVAFRELRGLKLLTPTEVAFWGRVPVVGMTTWPRRDDDLDALVAELDDYVPSTAGQTLVVAATDKEKGLVAEFACRLSEGWGATTVGDATVEGFEDKQVFVSQVDGADSEEGADEGEGAEVDKAKDAQYPVYSIVPRKPEAIVSDMGSIKRAFNVRGWMGEDRGPSLRRASRLADRVLVMVTSGEITAPEVRKLSTRLGRDDGLGFIIVGVGDELSDLPDRAGDVDTFWKAYRAL